MFYICIDGCQTWFPLQERKHILPTEIRLVSELVENLANKFKV